MMAISGTSLFNFYLTPDQTFWIGGGVNNKVHLVSQQDARAARLLAIVSWAARFRIR